MESLAENLAEMVEGTNLFKKGIDWWKYSICNGVMGSWPISILRKWLKTNLFKKGIDWWKYRKFVSGELANQQCLENLVESLAENLAENLVESLAENLAENLGGKWLKRQIYLRKALIGGNIAFGMG